MNKILLPNKSFAFKFFVIFAFMFFGLLVASVIVTIIGQAVGTTTSKGMLALSSVVQNAVAFIIPALAAVSLFSAKPWQSLRAGKGFSWPTALIIVAMYFVSIPFMNWLVSWNAHWALPDVLIKFEADAKKLTDVLLVGNSLSAMLGMVLVVGVLTAVGEEMMFRGALLGTCLDRPANRHVAVWAIALLFSAFHMQFLGFVPRMVLGVWLGYLLLYTGSIWAPVLAHALNNGMVVIVCYLGEQGMMNRDAFETLGAHEPWLALLSLVLSLSLFFAMKRVQNRNFT